MTTPVAAIGHLDADCFYVSAERVRDPFLEGKAVGVLGNQGACVIAKSYEMKHAGVKTGMPIWDALAVCPDGIFVKRDFRWYEVLSRLMLETVREFSSTVEYYSIDEFFFRASPLRSRTLQETALAIQARIMDEIGVPVSIGLARSRTLAKLISDTAKPRGALAILEREQEEELLGRTPVTEISGIAGRRARTLERWGIRTCLEFARADRALIRELLTASGEALWWELNGEPVGAIHPERLRHKTLSRGGSFGEATTDPVVLYAWLVRNLERLIEELTFHEMLVRRLCVRVDYKDCEPGFGQLGLTIPTDRFDLLLEAARPCLRRAWRRGYRAYRMDLMAEQLAPRRHAPLGLFDPPSPKAEVIARVKHDINVRRGRFLVRSGATLPLAAIYADTTNDYDICDVRGKLCF